MRNTRLAQQSWVPTSQAFCGETATSRVPLKCAGAFIQRSSQTHAVEHSILSHIQAP